LAMVAFSGSSGLDAQFRATRQQRAEAARKTKDSENNADATLVAWAKLQMGSSTASHSGSYSLTADMFSNWCVPQPGSGGVLVFHFLPPLASLGRKFFENAPKELTEYISSSFAKSLKRYTHAECPPLGKVPHPEKSMCALARMCICLLPDVDIFVGALQKALKALLKPKSVLRDLFDTAMLVVRIDTEHPILRLHLAHIHLGNMLAGVVPLVPDTDNHRLGYARRTGVNALVALNAGGIGACTWWQACAQLPFLENMSIAFERLSCRDLVVPFPILPGHVLTCSVPSVQPILIWDTKPKPQQKRPKSVPKPSGLVPLTQLVLQAAAPMPIMDGDNGSGHVEGEPIADIGVDDERLSCESDIDVAERMGWCDDAPDECTYGWGCPSSSEDEPPGAQPETPTLAEPKPVVDVAAPQPIVEIAGEEPVEEEGAPPHLERCGPEVLKGTWRHIQFSGLAGHIQFEPYKQEINAHCTCPGHKLGKATCKMDKKIGIADPSNPGRGRPAALLIAWLRDGSSHLGPNAKKEHQARKVFLASAAGHPVRAAIRVELVKLARTDPVLTEMLDTERQPFPDEDLEPLEISLR
jgi:hypothetical protein